MNRSVLIKSLSALLLALGIVVLAANPCYAVRAESVTVTGRSELQVPADHVELGFSVESRGHTESEMLKQNETRCHGITKAVSSYGMVCRNAFYTYQDDATGDFCAVSHFTLKSDRPKDIPTITDTLIAAGASSVEPPQYSLRDSKACEAKALSAAIADAEQRAKLCGAGERLVTLIDRREDICWYACREDLCSGTVLIHCTVTLTYRE